MFWKDRVSGWRKSISRETMCADELRSKFLLKKGDLMTRDKIAGGLDDLRQLLCLP